MTPAYDRELIADMLDGYGEHTNCDMGLTHFGSAIAEQARLLREANNAEAAKVGTVAASEDWLLGELDALIATEAKLNFARDGYDDDEATAYGISLLDFMRKRGMELRRRLAASGQGVDHG